MKLMHKTTLCALAAAVLMLDAGCFTSIADDDLAASDETGGTGKRRARDNRRSLSARCPYRLTQIPRE